MKESGSIPIIFVDTNTFTISPQMQGTQRNQYYAYDFPIIPGELFSEFY